VFRDNKEGILVSGEDEGGEDNVHADGEVIFKDSAALHIPNFYV
jgi:hypothetical protein